MGRRFLPHLPRIPSSKDASGRSGKWKRSKDTGNSLFGATVEPDLESKTMIMFEVKRRVILLSLCTDHTCKECIADFEYIALKIRDYPDSVTQKLMENGFLEIFQHALEWLFKNPVTEAACRAFISACRIVINMTDVSSTACRKVIQLELHSDIINSLKSGHLDPRLKKNQKLSPSLCELAEKLIAVLYNLMQMTPETSELYQKQGINEVIQRFRTGTSNSLSCFALMFLAWMISDKSSFNLNANDEDFRFLNQQLRSSLDTDTHRSDYGYKSVEILSAINMLVANDANKERFVKSGVLSSYVAFLEPHFDTEEQFLATQGLWSIAFKCAEEIKKEKFCVESGLLFNVMISSIVAHSPHGYSEIVGLWSGVGLGKTNPV